MSTRAPSFQSGLRAQPSHSSYTGSFQSTNNAHLHVSAPLTHLHTQVYNAVDPYAASVSHSIINLYSRDESGSSLEDIDVPDQYSTHQLSVPASSVTQGLDKTKGYALSKFIWAFVLDTLPRLTYSYFLLRLPSLYFSRVARVFEDAELTMPEIKRMALELVNAHPENVHQVLFASLSNQAPATSPFWNLKTNWESFIESLLREWKTFNIISVLLLSAILTFLQIDAAANDPLTRYASLVSLICALMSLLYGCVFIIRFGAMKKPHKAAEWAWEAQKTRTMIWWNIWVMLAMPVIWLSWSVVAYIICIMSFVWRTGSTLDGHVSPLEPHIAVWPRLAISLLLTLGIVYFALITATLSQYGSKMDRKWRYRVKGWIDRQIYEQPFYPQLMEWQGQQHVPSRKNSDDSYPTAFIPHPPYSRSPSPPYLSHANAEKTTAHLAKVHQGEVEELQVSSPVKTFKAIELRFQKADGIPLPAQISARQVSVDVWAQFTTETANAWNSPSLPTPQASILRILSTWNTHVFRQLCLEAVLCQEYYPEWPESPLYAIYMTDRQPVLGHVLPLEERFGEVPVGLIRLDVLDFSELQPNWVTLFPERGTEVHFKFSSQSESLPSSPQQPRRRGSILQTQHDHDSDADDNDNDEANDQDEDESHGSQDRNSLGINMADVPSSANSLPGDQPNVPSPGITDP